MRLYSACQSRTLVGRAVGRGLLTRLNAVKKQHDETMPGQANLIEDNAGNALLFNGLFSQGEGG
jgi:hypothetical protein